MKKISIIIVTFNSSQHIGYCLDSVFNQSFNDYEVIVVDNASEDRTKEILKNRYPDILLIENPRNYGFSKAVNQGIVVASGKLVLCLNDDTRLNTDFLANIHKPMEIENDIGAVQPKVLKPDNRIDTAGIYLSAFRRFYDIGNGEIDTEKFGQQRYVFGACAAAVLYRKEALEEIRQEDEYFDEDFFCIAEDVDISWRMRKKGWKILYYPDAVCIHTGGASRNNSAIRQYFSMRNRYLMVLKNESLVGFLKFLVVFFLYDIWRNLYMFLMRPRYFLKASYEIIELFPKMIGKRYLAYEN